jgi:hypothetical protein
MKSTFLRESCLLTNEFTSRMRNAHDCSLNSLNLQVDQASDVWIMAVTRFVSVYRIPAKRILGNIERGVCPNNCFGTLFYVRVNRPFKRRAFYRCDYRPTPVHSNPVAAAWRRLPISKGAALRPSASNLLYRRGNRRVAPGGSGGVIFTYSAKRVEKCTTSAIAPKNSIASP